MSGIAERELISLIRQSCGGGSTPELIAGIGDDCAVFGGCSDEKWLITTDTLADHVHFDRDWHAPELLGRKCVAVNFSDIAAMGGRPCFVLLSLCLPAGCEPSWLQHWLAGATAIIAEYGCLLIGGDTVLGRELVITVTVIGEAASNTIVYRSGARPGDTVYVSGPLGSAAAGLALFQKAKKEGVSTGLQPQWQEFFDAHLNPVPQVEMGQMLAASGWVSAMQDISDGLATDLAHICEESGVGSRLRAGDLPALPALKQVAAFLAQDALDLQLKGGEDYQLVFTVRPERAKELEQRIQSELGRRIFAVGTIVEGHGVLLEKEGRQCDITFQGYEHTNRGITR